jgi:hypothetical protein
MEYIINWIKEVLQLLNISDLNVFLIVSLSIVMILLYKHFYNHIDSNQKKEDENIKQFLPIFQKVILCLEKHACKKVSSEEAYEELFNLLPICSTKLKNKLLKLDLENSDGICEITKDVIEEFNFLKFNQYIISKEHTNSTMDTFEYHFRKSGLTVILKSLLFTVLGLLALILFISMFIVSEGKSLMEKIALWLHIISLVIFILLSISVIDLHSDKKVLKNRRFRLVACSVLFVSFLSIFITPQLFDFNNILVIIPFITVLLNILGIYIVFHELKIFNKK